MNAVDYVIIGLLGVSVLFGLYRGFISSVLNLGGGLLSFFGGFWLYPRVAGLIQSNQTLQTTLAHYLEPSFGLEGELGRGVVAQLDGSGIAQMVAQAGLPAPLDEILRVDLQSNAFANLNLTTVSEYVNQTVLQCSINILCFVAVFFVLYVVLSILLNLVRAVFRFPALKQLDGLAGGVFGLLRGLLICLALFTLAPLVQTMVQVDLINELLEGSALASAFMNGNLITAIMNGGL